MVTLDDKLLGEKLQNYCSSSDEDDEKGKWVNANWLSSALFFLLR
jgi:hypothetical protein